MQQFQFSPQAQMAGEAEAPAIPCCPELVKDDHCDVFQYKRILTFPVTVNVRDQRIPVETELILHFRFTRCTLGLTLGDPVYSTTLLPGEKVKLATTDRRSRFSYDAETKLSYRSEQIAEEQYYMTALQTYVVDGASFQSGNAHHSESGSWNFHGDAHGSVGLGLFGGSADASTNANGSHNSKSAFDYLNEQKSHVQSAAHQAATETHKAHSVSIGEVSTRTHIEGESEDHFEASSREFSNPNRCHAITFMFYRLNKRQNVTFELLAIERRVKDPAAPVRRQPGAPALKSAMAVVPQDISATSKVLADTQQLTASSGVSPRVSDNPGFTFAAFQQQAAPIAADIRTAALAEVDKQLLADKLIDNNGNTSETIRKQINFTSSFSLPTAGIIVKGCLDDCGVCEPWVQERMQLENELLKRQIELLEKSQEYRCCPPAPVIAGCGE